jgi:predicted RND superfamily exporter protein
MSDLGRQNVSILIHDINEWIANNTNAEELSFRFSGISLLNDLRDDIMTRNMFFNLILAFIVIAILMGLLYRQLKIVFIGLMPNVFPLLVVGAVLGYGNIELDASISIIFTIGYVIAVDDTIHFLSKFRYEQQRGNDVTNSVFLSLAATGKAMILSSLILFFGFLILLTSPFRETYYNGLLVSIVVFFALLADLLLLPALLFVFPRKQ